MFKLCWGASPPQTHPNPKPWNKKFDAFDFELNAEFQFWLDNIIQMFELYVTNLNPKTWNEKTFDFKPKP